MDNRERIQWPGWQTIRLIGRGSFGAVYEIQRDVFGDTEKAALKVISIPQNEGDIEEMYSDGYDDESITSTFQSHLESIVAEYSLMRKMNGCANIVNCDDVQYIQHDDGIGWDIFIKMELLTPLTKALSVDVSEGTVIRIAKDLCNALIVCKKNGIVHRDIKPQNIFVSAYGDYKLGDFGIAKTVEKTMGGTKVGTYKYMAPEVYNNQPYGSSADIYSLGLVLYWLLNERRMPFLPLPPAKLSADMDEEARSRRIGGEPLPMPAHGSRELKEIVMKACTYNPKARYQSAVEMMEDLQKVGIRWESKMAGGFSDKSEMVSENESVLSVDEQKSDETSKDEDSTTKTMRVWSGAHKEALSMGKNSAEPLESEKSVDDKLNVLMDEDAATEWAIEEKRKGNSRTNPSKKYWYLYVVLGLAAVALIVYGVLKSRNGWYEKDGYKYYYIEGEKVTEFIEIDDLKYYFDRDGRMQTGWIDKLWKYYSNEDGAIQTGLQAINGEKYYFNEEGVMQTGWQRIDDERYYFDESGVMQTGWLEEYGTNYYYNEDGVKQIGWQTIDGKKYYFNEHGEMQKSAFITIDGKEYCFNEDGVMQIGWQEYIGWNYYYNEEGVKQTGWQTIEGERYYFDEDGVMQTGIETIDEKKYYFNEDGSMHTGWLDPSGNGQFYYYGEDGVMQTGDVIIGDKKYILDDHGPFLCVDITEKEIKTSKSESPLYFTNTNGVETYAHAQILNERIENWCSLSGEIKVTDLASGTCDGEWQIHARTLDGKWERIGFFDVVDGYGSFNITFKPPFVTFDAYVCTAYDTDNWAGTFTQGLTSLTYRSYTFVE